MRVYLEYRDICYLMNMTMRVHHAECIRMLGNMQDTLYDAPLKNKQEG